METTNKQPEENKVAVATVPEKKPLQVWQQALINAETKFLAVAGKKELAKIELGFALMLMEKNKYLKDCTYDSIINAVINVARTGITLSPILKLAHLVPRKTNGVWECSLDFDYKGLVKVLKDNGCLKDIQAIIVYEDEKFEESNSPIIAPVHEKRHSKSEEEQKARVVAGCYSQVLLLDNTVIYTQFMPYWEIQKSEKVSQSASSEYSPWKKWREEMIKKTKIKRDFKTLISGNPNEKVIHALAVEEKNTVIDIEAQFTDVKSDAQNTAQNIENKIIDGE